MNTQTHLLLGMALLSTARQHPHGEVSSVSVNLGILFGALLPDLSLYVMWAQARAKGISNEVIFSELYFQEFWQQIGAVTNSVPLFALVLLIAILVGGRLLHRDADCHRLASLVVAVSAAALLHVACDLPLHHDDGHPHFWPLTNWVYSSPVSYWDPAHHGTLWSVFEVALGASLVIVLWGRFPVLWVRALLPFAMSSNALMALYWLSAFG